MPLFKSLRSKSSRKSTASVTSELDGNTDFGPKSPSSNNYGSVRSTKEGLVDKRSNSKRSLTKVNSSAPSSPAPALPRYTSSSSVQGDKGANEDAAKKETSMMQAVSQVNSPSPHAIDSTVANPRPSDLFAGKGVQWDAVKLAGPNITSPTANNTNNNEDMQNFLKMRRQWKPTFATEDDSNSTVNFQPPKDLSQLTFASGNQIQSQGLMSMKDLDESHRRKEKLMNSAPLGGSLWDEPETSQAASNRAAVEATPKSSKPTATRKESSRGRKLFGGDKNSRVVPPRTTSTQDFKPAAQDGANSASKATPETDPTLPGDEVSMPGALAPPIPAASVDGHSSTVRESMESNGNHFETPNGGSFEIANTGDPDGDGDKTLTANGNGTTAQEGKMPGQLSVETAIPKDTSIHTEPVTPRTVTEAVEERSVTPTPQATTPIPTS